MRLGVDVGSVGKIALAESKKNILNHRILIKLIYVDYYMRCNHFVMTSANDFVKQVCHAFSLLDESSNNFKGFQSFEGNLLV